MKQIPKIAAVIHLIAWTVLLLISVVARICWQAPASADGWDIMMIKGLYRVFILFSAAGVWNAALVLGAVKYFDAPSFQEHRRFDTVLEYVADATGILFYLCLVLPIILHGDEIFLAYALWLLCMVVCLVMLVIAAIRRARQKRKA